MQKKKVIMLSMQDELERVLCFIELSANMDAFDVRLADYNRELTELHSRIDTVTAQVHKQIEYYSTCDI